MKQHAHADFLWIDTETDFLQHWKEMEQASILALDTESNSYHGYQPQICLLQLATSNAIYLLDPLSLPIDCLRKFTVLLEDPNIPKIMHGADNDILGLQRDFSLRLRGLFDTMLAARFLNFPKRGLDALLDQYFGIHTSKKYQRFPWKQRPIPHDALHYAAGDVAYLLPMYKYLVEALDQQDRLQAVWEDSALVAARTPEIRPFDPNGFWKIKGANALGPTDMAVLESLYLWRHEFCLDTDTAAFRVVDDKTMLLLARTRPRTHQQLLSFQQKHRVSLRREAEGLLQAIEQGRQNPPPQRPVRPGRETQDTLTPLHEAVYEALKQWRERVAATDQLEIDLVATNQLLQTLARLLPTQQEDLAAIPGLTPWRIHRYGPAWLALIKNSQRSS